MTLPSGKVKKLLHRVVWETFVGKIPKGTHVNHVDGVKGNCRLSNLECVTPGENNLHAYRTKLKISPIGSKWHASKLSEKKVLNIKRMLSGGMSQERLAAIYGVNQCTISDIKMGVTWRHVRAE